MEQNQFSNQGFNPPVSSTGMLPPGKRFPLWAKVVIAIVLVLVLGAGIALGSRAKMA